MKQALFIAIFAIFLITTNSAQALLTAGSSFCTLQGDAQFQLAYYGKKIPFEEFNMTVLKKSSGREYNLTGKWIVSESNNSESEQTMTPKFQSDKLFFGKGAYVTTFTLGKERATFSMSCPGISCESDAECADDDTCNFAGICESLKCGDCQAISNHACTDKCNDNKYCTADACINNTCQNTYIPNCCLTSKDCNDGLMCTQDVCYKYRCEHRALECNPKESCRIGSCREFVGCIYDLNETCVKEKNKFSEAVKSSLFGKILKWMRLIS